MRKVFWGVLAVVMALAAIGNLIGGTDTPVRGALDPAAERTPLQSDIPVAMRFDATLYVSASSLNLRASPSTSGTVLASLPQNTQVRAGERRGGWVLVSANGRIGWVSGDYLAAARAAARAAEQSSRSRFQAVPKPDAASCPPRQYCTRIGSCAEAVWYYENCSWGALLDSDSDGVPCEAICE